MHIEAHSGSFAMDSLCACSGISAGSSSILVVRRRRQYAGSVGLSSRSNFCLTLAYLHTMWKVRSSDLASLAMQREHWQSGDSL